MDPAIHGAVSQTPLDYLGGPPRLRQYPSTVPRDEPWLHTVTTLAMPGGPSGCFLYHPLPSDSCQPSNA